MKLIYAFLLMCCAGSGKAQKKQFLLAGTYTNGKSTGVYVYTFDSQSGTATAVDSVTTSNPSYLAVAPNKRFVYAVNEDADPGTGGKVTAFSFDRENGKLTPLNQQLSGGDHPCYLTVDKTGKWVIAGNYSSGTVTVLPVKKDGSLGEAVSEARHTGSGTHTQRQEKAHVHATVLSPDNRFLFVPDLGIDKVMVYSFDSKTGKIKPSTPVKLPDGSGPRHFIFHPNGKWAYLIQELSGTVTAFTYSNGRLKKFQSVSTLPKNFVQPFTSADIHVSPDGKFLYASNRDSSNTIAVFAIHPQQGTLRLQGHQSTLGKTPRNFNFDPTAGFVIVANKKKN